MSSSSSPAEPAEAPLVFISHKHSDKEIAEAIANLIREKTGARFEVFVSSSTVHGHPTPGAELNAELIEKLQEMRSAHSRVHQRGSRLVVLFMGMWRRNGARREEAHRGD